MARRRRLIAGSALVAGSLAGFLFLRQRGLPGERVDVYLGDGSLRTLESGDPGGARLLELARAIAGEAAA